jgi:hypothetical protein
MENNKISLLENPKFPGIFVTKKKKSGKSNENDGNDHVKKERTSDSPTSDLGSDQCLSESISTSTAVYNFSSVKEVENGSSSCSYDNHCSCSESTEQGINEAEENEDKDGSKRPRRKKSKEKTEENPAADAIRYKTKMCKNWQISQKCPYGPRCLFAHGAKELRSHTLNQAAIGFASVSSSPERQFYALGRFPSFMPLPFNSVATSEDGKESVVEDQRENIQLSVQVTTHKPYSFPSPFKQEQQNVSQSDFQQTFVHQSGCEQNSFMDSRVSSFVTGPVNPYSASQFSAIELYGQSAALNAIACAFRSATCSLVVPPMELRR